MFPRQSSKKQCKSKSKSETNALPLPSWGLQESLISFYFNFFFSADHSKESTTLKIRNIINSHKIVQQPQFLQQDRLPEIVRINRLTYCDWHPPSDQ